MANTPQAKKRIRRNANRATINHSRISRIRTFIKAVESAIASGKKADAAEALEEDAAGNFSRSRSWCYPQEHCFEEDFRACPKGLRRSAKTAA